MPVHIIVKFIEDSKWVDPIQINWRLHLNNLQVLLVHKLHCLLIVICALVEPKRKGIRPMVLRAYTAYEDFVCDVMFNVIT